MEDMDALFPSEGLTPDSAWERLPSERADHYSWFCTYRDKLKPSKRSVENLRQLLLDEGERPTLQTLRAVFKANRWAERISDYDAECDRVKRLATLEEIEESSREVAKAADDLLRKGVEALGNLDAAKLSPMDIRQYIETAAKVKRLALGAPTDIVESKSGEDRDYVSELSVLLAEEFDLAPRAATGADDAGAGGEVDSLPSEGGAEVSD